MVSSSILQVHPTSELLKKIKEESNEDDCRRDQDLATIREWLTKQPHLPDEWEDSCLLNFLRGCNFSLEKTKRKLDMYFTMRTACPEFFTNRDVDRPEMKYVLSKAIGPTMPGLTPDGRRVSYYRGFRDNVEEDIINSLKIILMISDVRLREETEPFAGEICVFDASVMTPSHIGNISPSIVKKFLICTQEAYPAKVKEVHIINTSPIVDAFLTITKTFLSDKIKNRMFLHKDYKVLHDYIPKDMLPVDYGGTAPSLNDLQSLWVEKLKEYTHWFKKQDSIKANEALRPGKPTNYHQLFGVEGSFRQLAID